MQELDRAAAASGYARMHLTVHPDNTNAVRFYEELGWTKAGGGFEWKGRMEKALDTQSSVPVYGARSPHG
jgi:ribosomal protein S18 acetylase RimI-like enzyme